MPSYHEFVAALRSVDLDESRPAIAHTSLSAFGRVKGGAQSIAAALTHCFPRLMVPTFTYQTMVVPEVGPPDNALDYGSAADANLMAEAFHPDMPADRLIGLVAEALRQHPQATRSSHPILSFAGINVEEILEAQTLDSPLEPIRILHEQDGWVLLLGVDHSVNTSIHLGERMAGRRTFTRWALTPRGVVECPGFPSCSEGFDAIAPHLTAFEQRVRVGEAYVRAYPIREVVDTARAMVLADPLTLLCEKRDCPRCAAVRAEVAASRHRELSL